MAQPDEPRYTLAEARQMLKDERCATQGHELSQVGGDTSRLRCGRCDRTFRLVVIEGG